MAAAAILVAAGPTRKPYADEGQWTPDQLDALGAERLKRMGLEVPVDQLWNGSGGLLQAAVNYSGCSAGFVSDDGLVVTNHHCAYPAIQALSRPDRDLLKDGFLARKRSDEEPARGRGEIDVIVEVTDVTMPLKGAVDAAESDGARFEAAERMKNELSSTCEAEHPGHRCEVYAFYFGQAYRLIRTLHILDVRLVYAPSAAVGEFGGEVDNWAWPRHTGDFALLRAYVGPDGKPAEYAPDNVPYTPPVHFAVSETGVRAGDFVAVTGYPRQTNRYLPADEVERYRNEFYPAVVELYSDWVEILETASRKGEAVAIKVAASKKGLANRLKNARGMMAGFDRMNLVDRKRALETDLGLEARGVIEEAGVLTDRASERFPKAFLLDNLEYGPNLLAVAVDLGRLALSRELEPGARDPMFAERNLDALWRTQERRLQNFDIRAERPWLADVLGRLKAARLLPPRLAKARMRGPRERNRIAQSLLSKSRLAREGFVRRFFEARSVAQLRKASDPLLRLGFYLAQRFEEEQAGQRAIAGGWMRIGPAYLALLRQSRSGPLYPDANESLRISVAQVRGYIVEDGLQAMAHTTLSGQLQKHTGTEPFDLPENVRTAAQRRLNSRFVDRNLSDVPVCFLTTADTTGGNSGSPVIDGRGQLVGLNFDRVWENIAGDFAYNPAWSRNIVVDVRYLLWSLEEVAGAHNLVKEMGVGVRPVK